MDSSSNSRSSNRKVPIRREILIYSRLTIKLLQMDNLLLLNKRKRNLNTTTRETEFQLPRKATSKMISMHSSSQQLSTTMISNR